MPARGKSPKPSTTSNDVKVAQTTSPSKFLKLPEPHDGVERPKSRTRKRASPRPKKSKTKERGKFPDDDSEDSSERTTANLKTVKRITAAQRRLAKWKRSAKRKDELGMALGEQKEFTIAWGEIDSEADMDRLAKMYEFYDRDKDLTEQIRKEAVWWQEANYLHEATEPRTDPNVALSSKKRKTRKKRERKQSYSKSPARRRSSQGNRRRSQSRHSSKLTAGDDYYSTSSSGSSEGNEISGSPVKQSSSTRNKYLKDEDEPQGRMETITIDDDAIKAVKIEQQKKKRRPHNIDELPFLRYYDTEKSSDIFQDYANSYYTIYAHKESIDEVYENHVKGHGSGSHSILTNMSMEDDLYSDLLPLNNRISSVNSIYEQQESGSRKSSRKVQMNLAVSKSCSNETTVSNVEMKLKKILRKYEPDAWNPPTFRRRGKVTVRKKAGKRVFKFVPQTQEQIAKDDEVARFAANRVSVALKRMAEEKLKINKPFLPKIDSNTKKKGNWEWTKPTTTAPKSSMRLPNIISRMK